MSRKKNIEEVIESSSEYFLAGASITHLLLFSPTHKEIKNQYTWEVVGGPLSFAVDDLAIWIINQQKAMVSTEDRNNSFSLSLLILEAAVMQFLTFST